MPLNQKSQKSLVLKFVISLFFLSVLPSKALAEEDISNLSLEDLLNIKVNIATKTESNIDDVPAIVEVITAQKIKQRGYHYLADVLQDISDNHEDRSNWGIGEPLSQNVGFGFRFDTQQNILLLFNGQRLNAFLPGNRFGGEEDLLDNIDRIEIIRGPGSALYGANAFTSVINIISKTKNSIDDKQYVKVGGTGLFNSGGKYFNSSWKSNIGDKGFLSGAFQLGNQDGQSLLVKNSLMGDTILRDGINYALDGDLFFNYDKFNSYLKITNQQRKTFTGFNGINPTDNNKLNLFEYAYSLGADYTYNILNNLKLKTTAGVHLDNWTEVARIPIFKVNEKGDSLIYDKNGSPILDDTISVTRDGNVLKTPFIIDGQGADTRTLEGEAQLTYNYNEDNNIIFGINAINDAITSANRPSEIQISPYKIGEFKNYTDIANNWLFDPNASRNTLGAYSQIDYNLNNFLFFNGGARLDYYTGTGKLSSAVYTEVNPRAGVVYKNDLLGNIKLMYGSATRVPNGFETLSSVTILGSPDRRPEKLSTLQGQWSKNWLPQFRTELGGFFATISNRLQTDANITEAQKAQGFIGQFINIKEGALQQSSGIDGKASVQIGDVSSELNFTGYFYTNDGKGNEIGYIPKLMINGNVNIPIYWLNLNVGANYRGLFTQPITDKRKPIPDYLLLNATLTAKVPNIPFELSLGARNILNIPIRYPSSSQDFTEGFPGRGIDIWSNVSVIF